jgi:hypothetical protein
MWLVVPKIEGAHSHRKLHSVDFIERGRMCEKVERKVGKKRSTVLTKECWLESPCSISAEVILASALFVVRPLTRILTVTLAQDTPVSDCSCYSSFRKIL